MAPQFYSPRIIVKESTRVYANIQYDAMVENRIS